ncbi:hypothetical protein F4859DRAFT_488469 [Xylaria cf. heliscus]|nr:hypothetical protein F4859DRAFT_488469 [Xylaria cf. heliscus]
MNATPAEHPVSYQFNNDLTVDLPVLTEQDIDDFTVVLKCIARGTYPWEHAVVNALNAYNLTQDDDQKAWAYFYPVTDIPARDNEDNRPPQIALDGDVIADLEVPWQGMRPEDPQLPRDKASYRFLCFIHRHYIDTRYKGSRFVYTISIWDREVCTFFNLTTTPPPPKVTRKEKKIADRIG